MAEDDSQPSDGGIETPPGRPPSLPVICARCHRPLTRPSATGGCLYCVVDFVALDRDGGFASLAPGTEPLRRYSHFEIVLEADGTLAELGHGSMGTTYRAVDTVLQSPVALKVIGRNVADSPAVRARFLREARTAAKLRHPHVASVFHYGEQEGECFYVMELVEGETLEERVRRAGPLSPPGVLEVGLQVARALEAAELQGLVHRDLKPSNLMLVAQQSRGDDQPDETLVVKVIDFGLAKAVAADGQATGENDTRHGFVGTPAYASPEQFARAGTDVRVDTRSDIYSLGVTLWYLLCGGTPFRGQTLEEIHSKQVTRSLPLDQLTARRVPPPVMALLRSMLAVDPGSRPQNARELLDALQRCQGRAPGTFRRRLVPLGALVVLLLIAGTLAAILLRERMPPPTVSRPPFNPIDRSVSVLPFENRSLDAPEGKSISFQAVKYPKAWFEGISARMRGDEAAAHTAFASARTEIEVALQEDAGDPLAMSLLAVTDAGLGRADDAVREGRRARELIDEKKVLNRAATVDCQRALVYAWLGQRDLAFSLLGELVSKPAAIALLEQPTYGDFLLDPVWDPLRDDPRFAALLKGLAPKVAH